MTDVVGAAWRGSILVAVAAIVTSVALVGLDRNAVAYDLVQVWVFALPWWPFELRKILAFLLVALVVRLLIAPRGSLALEALVGRRVAGRVLERSS